MLGWLIAMSGSSIPQDMAAKSKSNAEYFDANGMIYFFLGGGGDRLFLHRIVQARNTGGNTGKPDLL